MRERFPLIDAARGMIAALVVLHHLCYDLTAFCGVSLPFLQSPLFLAARYAAVCTLFVLSGVSCVLSHSNLRRGALTLGAGLLLTGATAVFLPSQRILFGVLHCLGFCRLLWAAGLGRAVRRAPGISLGLCAVSAVLLRRLPEGVLTVPFAGELLLPPPPAGLGWLGLWDPSFFSADYFPLLPWAPVFFAGGALGAFWERRGFPDALRRDPVPALSRLGRHALPVYLLHQPVLFLLLRPLFSR